MYSIVLLWPLVSLARYISADENNIALPLSLLFRQTLAEFNPEIPVYLVRLDGAVQITDLNTLLPDAFSPKKLALKFHNGKC